MKLLNLIFVMKFTAQSNIFTNYQIPFCEILRSLRTSELQNLQVMTQILRSPCIRYTNDVVDVCQCKF